MGSSLLSGQRRQVPRVVGETIVGSRIVLSYLRNLPNKSASAVARVGGGKGTSQGNTASKTRPGHSAGPGASSALARVREVARADKGARFTALRHHVDLIRLRAAYWAIARRRLWGRQRSRDRQIAQLLRNYK